MTRSTNKSTITEDDVSVELAARVLVKANSLGTWHCPVPATPYTIGPGPVVRAVREIGDRSGSTFPHREPRTGRLNPTPKEPYRGIEEYVEELEDRVEGLDSELQEAVLIAWKYGAHDWVRMNFPHLVPENDHSSETPAPQVVSDG